MNEFPKQLDGRLLFKGSRFDVVEAPQQTADGKTVSKQVVRHPGAVVIVPLLEGDRVCLIRNERVAAGKTLIELPAGTLDPPEPPAMAAARELREETGYTAKNWRELPPFYMSPGICTEKMFVYVAQDLSAGDHAREEGENIENLVVSWSDAIDMAQRGDIEDGKTICALLMWDRLRNHEPRSTSSPIAPT
jgi:ADP-ribose pyrophosphatase